MVIIDKPTKKAVVPIVKLVLPNYLENIIAQIAGYSENGCEDKDGICYGHYCIDNYYDPRMCNETCSVNCLNNK